jgi:tetratricopeptide (TPR) repeat protein
MVHEAFMALSVSTSFDRLFKHRGTLLLWLTSPWLCLIQADDYTEALDWTLTGQYEQSLEACEEKLENTSVFNEQWYLLGIKNCMHLGNHKRAFEILQDGLEDRKVSGIKLYPVGHEVALWNNQPDLAQEYLDKSAPYINSVKWSKVGPENLVHLGRAALKLGVDPRVVLELFYDVGIRATPPLREAYVAAADLALMKEDFAVAESTVQRGLENFPEDADLLFCWAQALKGSSNEQMGTMLNRTLEANPQHVGAILMLADNAVDAENYETAQELLKKAQEINPNHAGTWAYEAVIAHLQEDPDMELEARHRALQAWPGNPEVDHLIGRKLSQKYRFKEGAAYQKTALKLDADYQKASIQLAQDLLRLGEEEQGWQLAEDVHASDGYNVTAYNLVQLKSVITDFTTLRNQNFLIRMAPDEAIIYGNRVMELLMEAKSVLCAKYKIELEVPVIVEIFPNQSDFGVRTFGMPHNPGFLGVCFGNVITANSPSSSIGRDTNWQAVLWHEFCHVITLNLTKNKMPRWLSEGISVHEEIQRDRSWGQHMTPDYRQRIMRGEMTPIGSLSGAFLNAESGEDMQFAYFQSSLVVDYIVEQHGRESLQKILVDLGDGIPVNEAIGQHAAEVKGLNADFMEWAQSRASQLGETLNWDEPEQGLISSSEAEVFLESNPENYYLLIESSRQRMQDEDWEGASLLLSTLLDRYPDQPGLDGALYLASVAARKLGKHQEERQHLQRLAAIDGDVSDVYRRLIAMAREEEDWEAQKLNAERYLAVNPLTSHPYEAMAEAAENLNNLPEAIQARRVILELNPTDPALAHYKLARLLDATGNREAKRHVLLALEEAPRYREAQTMLLKLRQESMTPDTSTPQKQGLPHLESTLEETGKKNSRPEKAVENETALENPPSRP